MSQAINESQFFAPASTDMVDGLVGRYKADNQPVLIGDKDRARAVYQGGKDLGATRISQGDTQDFLDSPISEQVARLTGRAS